MAKNNAFKQLLAATDARHLPMVATGSFLAFFIFVGAFFTTESTATLLTGKSNLLLATGVGGPTGPNGQYQSSDLPTVSDSFAMGKLRGTTPEVGPDGKQTGKGCQLADQNCDGVITEGEWRAWSYYTIGSIRARCDFVNCHDCYRNPRACSPEPTTRSYIYSYGTFDLFSSLYLLKFDTCVGGACDGRVKTF
jgi:hypothetical protein